MTCRTCKHLDVAPDKNGKIVPRKSSAYKCTVTVEMPKLPDCMTEGHRFNWPFPRSYMVPDWGKECPFHEVRVKS